MQFSAGTTVQVVNLRSLACGRKGMVTGRRNGKIVIRFADLPKLSAEELADPTGLTARFNASELQAF